MVSFEKVWMCGVERVFHTLVTGVERRERKERRGVKAIAQSIKGLTEVKTKKTENNKKG